MAEYVSKAELLWLMDETKEDRVTREVIENHPTIDIVHCSECKYWEKEYGVLNPISTAPGYATIEVNNYCTKRMLSYDAEYFCADGERKE